MPPPTPAPKYIYKITESEPPVPLPTVFPPLPLDKQDGFVHLSTARQVPQTASRFFASHRTLYLVQVRLGSSSSSSSSSPSSSSSSSLAALTKWERPPPSHTTGTADKDKDKDDDDDDTDNWFPHLYGSFGAADIQDVRKVERDESKGEKWTDVLGSGENGQWLK